MTVNILNESSFDGYIDLFEGLEPEAIYGFYELPANDSGYLEGSKEKPSASAVPKPTPLPVIAEGIPEALRSRAQWVCWKYVLKGDRWTKPPFRADGRGMARANDPETWASFDEAMAAYRAGRADGIGFCFAEGDGLAGVDLDHVLDEAGEVRHPVAAGIVAQFRSTAYIERSPGGDGLRLFVLGTTSRCGKGKAAEDKQWIEAYDHRSPRFLTVTGQRLDGSLESPADGQAALAWLARNHMGGDAVSSASAAQRVPGATTNPAADEAVIRRIKNSRQGVPFRQLFEDGQYFDLKTSQWIEDRSVLDAKLIEILAFFCNRDSEQMDRIFRRSALMRDKWDERRGSRTYGQLTVGSVLRLHAERGGRTVGDWDAEHGEGDDREPIRLVAGDRHRAVDAIQEILGRNGVYQIGGALYGLIAVDGVPEPSRLLRPTTLGTYLARYAVVQKYHQRDEEWKPAELPAELAKAVVDEGHYPGILEIRGIARQPFLREDGSLCNAAGYDGASKLFCAFSADDFPGIPERPTRADAETALRRVAALFDEVEFEGARDRAAAVAACLTAATRRSLRAAPAFLHTAHLGGSGAGKNYSEGMIERFATAGRASPLAHKTPRSELDKSLFSALMRFPDVVRFDELSAGSALAGSPLMLNMLTEPFVSDRELGFSKIVTVPANVMVQLSGNGITIEGDMRRRTVEIFYAPTGQGQFTKDPFADLIQHRGEYIAAALTIVRAWLVADAPASREPVKNYAQWDTWCCQPLIWLGMQDPAASLLGNMNSTDGSLVDADLVAEFIRLLRKSFGTQWFVAKDIVGMTKAGTVEGIELSQAARALMGESESGPTNTTRVGKILSRIRSMTVDGWSLQKKDQGNTKAAAKWRVRELHRPSGG